MVRRRKPAVRMLLVLALAAATLGGCFGSMNATSRLKTWNREIENRWVGEGAYVVLRVPYGGVYALVGLTDLLVFNSVEFWTGEHPIDPVSAERMRALRALDARRHGPRSGKGSK